MSILPILAARAIMRKLARGGLPLDIHKGQSLLFPSSAQKPHDIRAASRRERHRPKTTAQNSQTGGVIGRRVSQTLNRSEGDRRTDLATRAQRLRIKTVTEPQSRTLRRA